MHKDSYLFPLAGS